jgi:hypothetical protein
MLYFEELKYERPLKNSKYNISSAGENRKKNANLAIFSRLEGSNISLKI